MKIYIKGVNNMRKRIKSSISIILMLIMVFSNLSYGLAGNVNITSRDMIIDECQDHDHEEEAVQKLRKPILTSGTSSSSNEVDCSDFDWNTEKSTKELDNSDCFAEFIDDDGDGLVFNAMIYGGANTVKVDLHSTDDQGRNYYNIQMISDTFSVDATWWAVPGFNVDGYYRDNYYEGNNLKDFKANIIPILRDYQYMVTYAEENGEILLELFSDKLSSYIDMLIFDTDVVKFKDAADKLAFIKDTLEAIRDAYDPRKIVWA